MGKEPNEYFNAALDEAEALIYIRLLLVKGSVSLRDTGEP